MKNVFLSLVLLLGFSFSAHAQFDTNNLFGGGNLAYASPTGDFDAVADGGISYDLLIGYKLNEKLGIGIEYGGAVMVGSETEDGSLSGLSTYSIASYLAKGWYCFSTTGVKPYAGLGFGLAQVEEPSISDTSGNTIEGAKRTGFGLNAELGLSIKGFNLSYSYNLAGKTPEGSTFFPERYEDVGVSYHRFAIGYLYNF
jgi:hypothetical protein